jgi:uncharacterized membrane protein YfcA
VAAGSVVLIFAALAFLLGAGHDGQAPHAGPWRAGFAAGIGPTAGYFRGRGSGVMALSLMLLTVEQHLPRANALKNVLVGTASVASAVVFIVFGPVDWAAAVPLGTGMFAGSLIGPRLARRIPASVLRWLVALLGLSLAVKLWMA